MKYNAIHKEYRFGMGLWFKLIFNHQNNPSGWISLSNVPALDHKKLESDNQEDAVYEVMGSIDMELEYSPEEVQASLPKIFPKYQWVDDKPKIIKDE